MTCYLHRLVGDTGDIFGQQDQYGSSVLPLGLEVFLRGEVQHLHDDTAAGQHRLVRRASLRHHDGSTATSVDREGMHEHRYQLKPHDKTI